MTSSEILAAIEPVILALEALGVRYYVAGSLASSAHGVPRASIDADVVADLRPTHASAFVARLQEAYYVDLGRVQAAIASRRSFNVIHLQTMFKVDVFAAKARPFDREMLRRARPEGLDDAPDARQFFVASAEDTILAKLEWFREGGEVSERQWTDVVGVLKTGSGRLDEAYLRQWAKTLGLDDLFERVWKETAPGAE